MAPMGGSIVRKWGELWGGVYLIPKFPSNLIKLKAMEELFSKGCGGIL
jgi:hypothetical protein